MAKFAPHKHKTIHTEKKEDVFILFNPYILLSLFCIVVVVGIGVYHFFFANPTLDDPTTTNTEAAVGGWKSGRFPFFGKTIFSKSPPLELSVNEITSLGIPASTAVEFLGAKTDNLRDKRRLMAIAKYEGGRKLAEERQKELLAMHNFRNNHTAAMLKEAYDSLQYSDSLGLMKLESFIANETRNRNIDKNNIDSLIFAYQQLTSLYIQKNMKEKAREAYLNYLRLIKEKAPPEFGAQIDQAISEIEGGVVTSRGN